MRLECRILWDTNVITKTRQGVAEQEDSGGPGESTASVRKYEEVRLIERAELLFEVYRPLYTSLDFADCSKKDLFANVGLNNRLSTVAFARG